MDIIKVESAQMGGNCIVNLIYLADGSVISTNECGATVHTAEDWANGMAWFFGFGESPEDEEQWERENLAMWDKANLFEYPDVWVHGTGFRAQRAHQIDAKEKD